MAGQCTSNTSMISPEFHARPRPNHSASLPGPACGRNSKHHLMYWDLLLDLLGLLTLTVGFFFWIVWDLGLYGLYGIYLAFMGIDWE